MSPGTPREISFANRTPIKVNAQPKFNSVKSFFPWGNTTCNGGLCLILIFKNQYYNNLYESIFFKYIIFFQVKFGGISEEEC